MAGDSYRRIEAVTKALEVLEFLATQKEPITGPDIARAVQLPTATVMCHLVTLQDKNFVRQVGGGFELGMGAATIWARKKALLEGQRDRISKNIQTLEEGK
ncbi:helix-turn-helix domain-containing protein [Geobacter sp.]|uniref:helix-turn-helix domain-containing protein n=1 Tax=Geobacter sp. TaxID=46610 RepID=UPI0026237DA3|nr:helix-turn-helix domain-containing protein [Geobacter sp.]